MIEWFESIDRAIVVAINSWNSPLLDDVMWTFSARVTWIPLYVFLIYLGFKQLGWKKALFYFVCTISVVGCTDFICSGIIKELVQRYRPSHNLLITDTLHFYQFENGDFYKGGQYGFVSSHAGNFFALSWFVGWVMQPYYKRLLPTLLILSILISYSRIYFAVHYLSDIIGGFIIGTGVAFLIYKYIYLQFENQFNSK
ncbi:MAG: phosphatase PAP2 family protein [Crocinitomicaceae bacterium]|nr:phosphatase PAP2 family protein [Crocinitomicaceae bacterium]